jgi:hypothetical protein
MIAFIESVGWLALVAAILVLARWLWRHATSRGLRHLQEDNAAEIQTEASRTCPEHGEQAADRVVRVGGIEQCPECYREVVKHNPNFSNKLS